MQTFIQSCTAGCGRTRTINLPNGAPAPSGTYLCNFDDPSFRTTEQLEADKVALEIIARRLQLRNDLEALKANSPVWWLGVFG